MYLFNPENDLALANFSPNYTPPASAIRMSEELAILPVWYAGASAGTVFEKNKVKGANAGVGDEEIVIAGGALNRSFLEGVRKVLPVQATLIPPSGIGAYPHRRIIPWGWNPALRRKLIVHGADENLLPSLDELTCLRGYSSRQHAVEILRELVIEAEKFGEGLWHSVDYQSCKSTRFNKVSRYCGESHFFTDTEALYAYLESFTGDKVLKMPLSGSGKGLIWILGEITDKQRDWCRRVVREQGGVVAEPVLDKVQDFAMEFYLHGGQACFAGYSMFEAAASGAYMGNALLSDLRIEEKLSEYVPVGLLHQLRNSLTEKLSRRFPHYNGYAGVDMMICETHGGYCVQPCVEINMRMNMGMVAHIFYERYMVLGTEGKFRVDYCKKPESALSFHRKMQHELPLSVDAGKLLSGYLSLTPVTKETRYIAYVVAG